MINPCAIKGIAVFLALARSSRRSLSRPCRPGGRRRRTRRRSALPNVKLLEPQEDIDRIFARTRVLLMPSLWQEAFGVTAVEAMLRGIPVLASDVGGLPEAKLGTDLVLPVRPIERYTDELDGNEVTVPEVPDQEIGPWREALSQLLADGDFYARQSREAREAAHRFVAGLGIGPFEEILTRLGSKERRRAAPAGPKPPEVGGAAGGGLEGLTPEQRALLMLRLRKKNGS